MIGLFRGLPLRYGLGAVAFPIILLLCFSTAGCANSCFVAVLNPGGTVIGVTASNLPLACPPPIKKATFKVLAKVTTLCEACSPSNRIQGFLLTLGGIELHAKTSVLGHSSEWLELFPDLEKLPRQVELLTEKMNAVPSESTEEPRIPAGSYDLVRLSLAGDQIRTDDQFLLRNVCGNAGPNCVVMMDGQIAPLVFEADTLEFRLTSESTVDGLPFVLPDSNNELLIELTPVLSMARPFEENAGSFTIFSGRARMEPWAPGGSFDNTGRDLAERF